MPPTPRSSSSAVSLGRASPLAWWGILALLGAAGLLGLGVYSLFQAARSAEEAARLEAGRTAAVTARALRAALSEPEVLDLLEPRVRFSVEEGRLRVPADVGWLDPPFAPRLPDALSADARETVVEARRVEFQEGDRDGALQRLAHLSADASLAPPQRRWVALAAANCAHRAGAAESRRALLEVAVAGLDGAARERPRDDVLCGLLVLWMKIGRPIPPWFSSLFARTDARIARTALDRAKEVRAGSGADRASGDPALGTLEKALLEVVARRTRLRRVRELLPSLRTARSELRSAGTDVLIYFGRSRESGAGALVDVDSLARTIDLERRRSEGRLGTVGSAGLLLHGPRLAATPYVLPVIPGLLGVAPNEASPSRTDSQWRLNASVAALAVFLVLGLGVALGALRKEQLHTRARAEFLTAVTHELKTPLASIRLLVDVLSDERAGHDKRSLYLERLAGETARLTMLVENVLDLGRIQRGERGYDLREENLTDVVLDAIALYRPLAARDHMELDVRLDRAEARSGDGASGRDACERWTVSVDRGAITQILLNLFENARRYASSGGIIEVTGSRRRESFQLLVEDRGAGIPEAQREAIFERFHRGVFARDAANPGVGLGLYLARAIARDHGGDLRCVAPQDGPGAAFELILPLASAASAETLYRTRRGARLPPAPAGGSVEP